jgi:hypothetical protein
MSDKTTSKSLDTLRAGASALLPIYPENFQDVVRLARMSIISGMIKPLEKGFGERKEIERPEATEARATMIILQGMEIGLPPMQSTQLIAMINGRMTVHSEGVPAILLSKGIKITKQYVGTPYEDDFKAVCTLTRPDGDVFISEFSVSDAKEANLWDERPTIPKFNGGSKPNDSSWYRYKKRMLWARALGFAAKDGGADAMRGLMVREEVEDMVRSRDAIDLTPVRQIEDIPEVPPDDGPDIIDPIPEVDVDVPTPDTMSPEAEANALRSFADAVEETDLAFLVEVLEGYEDVIASMSDAGKDKAEQVLVRKILRDYAKSKNKAKTVDEATAILDKLGDPARRSVEAVFERRK